MSLTGSVTRLLRRLRSGDQAALRSLLPRYWGLLLGRARRHLDPKVCRAAGVEDVAQEVVCEFYRGVENSEWGRLDNRKDLVALLLHLTDCRALNAVRHERARKRGGGHVRDENAFADNGPGRSAGLDQAVPDDLLPPDEAVAHEELWQRFQAQLDDSLLPFVQMRLDEWPIGRMAEVMQCSERTVYRKLALIQALARQTFGPL